MQWQDNAIILGVKRHGETSVVVEVMTRSRGRHMGMVRGGRSRSMQPVLQAGNLVEATWRARLHEHLGEFRMEPVTLRAARLMETATPSTVFRRWPLCFGYCRSVIRTRISTMHSMSSWKTCRTLPMPASFSCASNSLS